MERPSAVKQRMSALVMEERLRRACELNINICKDFEAGLVQLDQHGLSLYLMVLDHVIAQLDFIFGSREASLRAQTWMPVNPILAKTALIVDDVDVIRHMIRVYLESLGMEVMHASSGSSRTSSASAPTPRPGTHSSGRWTRGCCGSSRAAPHRRHQRQPHDADGPEDARLGRRAARPVRRAPRDAARDPLHFGGLRRDPRRRAVRGRDPGRGRPRRPARRARRPGLLEPAASRTPTAPATSWCSTPAPRSCGPSAA